MRINLIFSLIFVAGVFACKHEPLNPPLDPQDGSLPDCQLLSSTPKNAARQYMYQYDSLGRLASRLELWSGALRVWHILRYSGDRLVAREMWTAYTVGEPKMNFYDTLLYNTAGQISEVRTLQPDNGFTAYVIDDYTYDAAGRPISSRAFYPSEGKYLFSKRYTWENGNIVKIEDYSGGFAQLLHEWFYEYNTGINPEQLATLFPETPENQNRNLVRTTRATDYTGLLDLECNPCEHKYVLNPQGLPVLIRYGWDNEIMFEWDCH